MIRHFACLSHHHAGQATALPEDITSLTLAHSPILWEFGRGFVLTHDTHGALSSFQGAGASISGNPCGCPAPQNAHAFPVRAQTVSSITQLWCCLCLSKARPEFRMGTQVDVQSQWKTHVVRDSGRWLSTRANGQDSGLVPTLHFWSLVPEKSGWCSMNLNPTLRSCIIHHCCPSWPY